MSGLSSGTDVGSGPFSGPSPVSEACQAWGEASRVTGLVGGLTGLIGGVKNCSIVTPEVAASSGRWSNTGSSAAPGKDFAREARGSKPV